MKTLVAVNVNHAYRRGLQHIAQYGKLSDSRYGTVLVCDEPVCTTYLCPDQRILFDAQRDANPFFHLIEALWMLAGRNDVATLEWLLPRMKEFSDDGVIFHGAYGHRWRHWQAVSDNPAYNILELDQLRIVINSLRANPNDRRIVIAMWDPARDLGRSGKDLPCNDMIKFRVVDDKLQMYVFNRSNDAIWGAYGANAVHFSMLQEYVAQMCEFEIGRYEQISTDFHAYTVVWDKSYPFRDEDAYDPYRENVVQICPLVGSRAHFDEECEIFMQLVDDVREYATYQVSHSVRWRNPFFALVAYPMLQAVQYYKRDNSPEQAAVYLEHCMSTTEHFDWLEAGFRWMVRRASRRAQKVN